jgi:hypothetical protein
MNAKGIGILVMVAGVLLALLGVLMYFGALSWFGRLPGDLRVERESVRIYVPVTSLLLLSVAFSLLLYLIRRFLG